MLSGCVESTFLVPYPSGQLSSKLWTTDPRTKGWDSVHVEYWFLTHPEGTVKAVVSSGDGKHCFAEKGSVNFYQHADGHMYNYDSHGMSVLTFHGKSERYQFATNHEKLDRNWMLVLPDTAQSTQPSGP